MRCAGALLLALCFSAAAQAPSAPSAAPAVASFCPGDQAAAQNDPTNPPTPVLTCTDVVNAVYAAAYIWGVGLFFQWLSTFKANTPDSILDPIGALSLLVFSAALMAYLFFYRPVVLILDGKREEAVSYFLKTLATFGAITALVFVLVSVIQ